ncbi:MAG TPA: YlxR family protein [Sphingobacteriaceae bacterium]|nr:YlxR family protein [Sphingobacteriaceae bacterium]
MGRQRHVPQRTCIGCNTVRPKRELVRLVRTPAGPVVLDKTGKLSGRGAYVCPDPACVERALTLGRLTDRLKADPDQIDLDQLREQLKEIAEGVAGGGG